MKTKKTVVFALLVVASCAFFFGMGQHEVPAAPIGNCVSSCCENVYSWWIDGSPGGTQSQSAQTKGAKPPFMGATNTLNAIVSIFVPAPSNSGCKLNPAGNFDRWIWANNMPTCKNKDGTLPSPQPVLPDGDLKFDMNVNRNQCGN